MDSPTVGNKGAIGQGSINRPKNAVPIEQYHSGPPQANPDQIKLGWSPERWPRLASYSCGCSLTLCLFSCRQNVLYMADHTPQNAIRKCMARPTGCCMDASAYRVKIIQTARPFLAR